MAGKGWMEPCMDEELDVARGVEEQNLMRLPQEPRKRRPDVLSILKFHAATGFSWGRDRHDQCPDSRCGRGRCIILH